jgi:protein disulfide-isomerase A6
MLLAFLAPFSHSVYIDITSENQPTVIGGDRPIFVKFFSPTCGHCRAMAEDFAEAAAAFTEVDFGGVDCSIEVDFCTSQKIEGYPTLLLYLPKSKEGISYEGTRTSDAFCDFVENYTNFRAKRPPKVYVDLNPLNFERHLAENRCLLVTFYARWCQHSKRWLPQSRTVATALIPDRNVSVALVNCESYDEFCDRFDVKSFPAIRLFTEGNVVAFDGSRSAANVLEFVNEYCGTGRDVNGLLNDTAGVIPEAAPIVQEFLENEEGRSEAIKKMKEVEGADFYVKVMERFVAGGISQIRSDMAKMGGMLAQRKAGWTVLDGMKKRYNIFAQFDPPLTPTPAPESTDEPGTTPADL